MFYPLFGNRKYFYLYTGIWIIIASVQFVIMIRYNIFGINVALTESIVQNLVIALLGLAIWFPVYFLNIRRHNVILSIIHHIFISLCASAVWYGITYLILSTTFGHIPEYVVHLKSSSVWRIAIGILYYFIIVLLYAFIMYYHIVQEKLVNEAKLKTLIKESELTSLKFQINPHFLFNSLNSISSLTMISPEKAQDMIIKLSEFLRYSLSSKNEQLTTVAEEMKNINRYLDIEKVRFGKRLNVIENIGKNCRDKRLPGLILQPLIENAIKYGIYESVEQAEIKIQAVCNEEVLKIVIENDYDPDYIVIKGEGIGLKNIRNRLKIIYSNENLMRIINNNKQFQVTITFPQNIKS